MPEWPRRVYDQNFGLALSQKDLLDAAPTIPNIGRWWQTSRDFGTIKTDKNKFQVNVDVQHFAPDEITVKIANGYILVEGKHEEKKDEHGFVSRQFLRKFKLPEGSNADAVESRLSSDGVLSVIAPICDNTNERSVPITQTGPIRKSENEVK